MADDYIKQIKDSLSDENLLTLIYSLPFSVLRDERFRFTKPVCLKDRYPEVSGVYIATYAYNGKDLYTGFVYYTKVQGTSGTWSFMQQTAQEATPQTHLYIYSKPEYFYWVGLTNNLFKE